MCSSDLLAQVGRQVGLVPERFEQARGVRAVVARGDLEERGAARRGQLLDSVHQPAADAALPRPGIHDEREHPDDVIPVLEARHEVEGDEARDLALLAGIPERDLRAARLAGVPAIEVRAVSNEIEEPDRARWRFEEAFRAVADATPRLIAEIAACVS